MRLQIALGLALISCGFLLGCSGGSSINREDISGKAMFNGEPIVFGMIEFLPDQSVGHDAPAGSATIIDGQYDSTIEGGFGIVAGPHEIRVTAYPKRPEVSEDETIVSEPVEPIFVGYSIQADVTPPTYDIDIPADAAGFDFAKQGVGRRSNEP